MPTLLKALLPPASTIGAVFLTAPIMAHLGDFKIVYGLFVILALGGSIAAGCLWADSGTLKDALRGAGELTKWTIVGWLMMLGGAVAIYLLGVRL